MADLLSSIRRALKKANLTHVANATGLNIKQIREIRDGKVKGPRWGTMTKLAKHFGIPLA